MHLRKGCPSQGRKTGPDIDPLTKGVNKKGAQVHSGEQFSHREKWRADSYNTDETLSDVVTHTYKTPQTRRSVRGTNYTGDYLGQGMGEGQWW